MSLFIFHRLAAAAACAAAACGWGSVHALQVQPAADLSTWACTGVCGASGAQGDIGLSPLGNAAYGYVATASSTARGVSPVVIKGGSRGSNQEENGSRWVSGAFSAANGDQLSMHFNYVSTDGKNFDDYAWARVVNANDNTLVAWLFTAQSNNSSTGQIVPGDVVPKSDFNPDDVIVDFKNFKFNSRTAPNYVNWAPLGASNQTCWKSDAEGCGFTGWLQSQVRFASAGSFRVEVGVVNFGDELYDSGLAFDLAGLTAPVPEPASWALLLAGGALLLQRRRAQRLWQRAL